MCGLALVNARCPFPSATDTPSRAGLAQSPADLKKYHKELKKIVKKLDIRLDIVLDTYIASILFRAAAFRFPIT